MTPRWKEKYRNPKEIVYYSPRYKKTITVPQDYPSDGATGARDIDDSISWWVHDVITDEPHRIDKSKTHKWDDGTDITWWQASVIIHDILRSEKRWIRCVRWGFWTLVLGPKW